MKGTSTDMGPKTNSYSVCIMEPTTNINMKMDDTELIINAICLMEPTTNINLMMDNTKVIINAAWDFPV